MSAWLARDIAEMTLEIDPTSGTSCSQPALPTAPAHASSCEQAALASAASFAFENYDQAGAET